MSRRALLRAGVACALLGGCRDVIGYDAVTLGAPDTGVPAPPTCPSARPTLLFTSQDPLFDNFVGGGRVFATDVTPSLVYATGLVVCPEVGCDEVAHPFVDPAIRDGGAIFGGAASNDAGVLYSFVNPYLSGRIADAGTGYVALVDWNGGPSRTVATHLNYPLYMVGTGDDVYWVDDPTSLLEEANQNGAGPWSAWHARVSGDGRTAEKLFEGAVGITAGIFTDAKNLYVFAQQPNGAFALFACARAGCGGNPTVLLAGLDDTSQATVLDSFVTDGTSLFHAAVVGASGSITRTSLEDPAGTGTVLASKQVAPTLLTLDSTYVYWATGGEQSSQGRVSRVRKDGQGEVTYLACGLTGITGLAVDTKAVYVLAAQSLSTGMFVIPL